MEHLEPTPETPTPEPDAPDSPPEPEAWVILDEQPNGFHLAHLSKRAPMDPARRCTAHLSDGSGRQCAKAAMKGGFVCRSHGGAKKSTIAAAKARLENLRFPAIATLRDIMLKGVENGNYPSAVRAAIAVLDRTGFHPSDEPSNLPAEPRMDDYLLGVDIINLLTLETRRMILRDMEATARRRGYREPVIDIPVSKMPFDQLPRDRQAAMLGLSTAPDQTQSVPPNYEST